MNKNSIIAVFASVLIGMAVGAWLMNRGNESTMKDFEKDIDILTDKQEVHLKNIDSLKLLILERDKYIKRSDSLILNVKSELFRKEQELIEEKKKVDEYTNEELTNYLYNRYHKP